MEEKVTGLENKQIFKRFLRKKFAYLTYYLYLCSEENKKCNSAQNQK